MAQSILIIEDNLDIMASLERTARKLGLSTDYALDGELGLKKANTGAYDLLLIDVNLPEKDGFEICSRVREKNQSVGIIFVTCRESELDRLNGFTAGADDYVLKPFSEDELAARMKAILRRSQEQKQNPQNSDATILDFGDLIIDTESRTVHLQHKPIDLTALEFQILLHIAKSPGRVFTREELTGSLWGYNCTQFGPSITSYFSRLRSKLEPDPRNPRFIKTVHGVGYKFLGGAPEQS